MRYGFPSIDTPGGQAEDKSAIHSCRLDSSVEFDTSGLSRHFGHNSARLTSSHTHSGSGVQRTILSIPTRRGIAADILSTAARSPQSPRHRSLRPQDSPRHDVWNAAACALPLTHPGSRGTCLPPGYKTVRRQRKSSHCPPLSPMSTAPPLKSGAGIVYDDKSRESILEHAPVTLNDLTLDGLEISSGRSRVWLKLDLIVLPIIAMLTWLVCLVRGVPISIGCFI